MKYNVSKLEEKIKQNENETAKAMDDAAVQRQTLKDMREQYDMLKR
jgi:hypothetical protein